MKKNIVGLLGLATLLLGYGTVSAQSIPTIGSTMTTTTIAQPYQQSQCVEPDGSIVYENRHFYLGDTYTTTDVVPKWGNGYDTLLLNATKVLIYNTSLFNFTSPIQWKSNGIPSNAPVNAAVVSQGTFVVNSTSPGQLVYNIHRTALENKGSSSYSLAYLGRSNLVNYTAQLSNKTFHNQAGRVVNGYECVNYTVHYCGDGIIDTKQSIAGLAGGIANSIANEQCDGTAGVPAGYSCTSTCTLQQTVVKPTCTLSVSSGSIQLGNSVQASWTINGNYTNTPQITYTPTTWSITGLPHTITSANGQKTITPQHTGTYTLSMMVSNTAGQSICTTQILVNAVPVPTCSLTTSTPSIMSGQNALLSASYTNAVQTIFTPAIGGLNLIYPNRNNSNIVVKPTTTTTYTMTVNGQPGSTPAICQTTITVTSIPTPTCSLTTSTPTINSGENALLSAGYTNASLATLTPTIAGLNFIYPNRSNSNIVVKPTTTTTYTLSTLGIGGEPGAICSVTVNVKNTSVTLSKILINDILYRSGDLVSFRIDFANQGNTTVNNVVLTDNLPGGLDYVSSQIFGVSPYTMGTGMSGGNPFLQYSGFSLVPGQVGYFIVTGKFKGYAYASQNMNHVYLNADNIATLYANAQFHTYVPSANATITKTVDKISYTPGEDVNFAITVTNNGPDTIDNVQIIDIWPNSSCIVADIKWTAAGSVPMSIVNNGAQPYTWNLDASLPVGQSVYLYLLGHIANNPSCAGTYTNVVNLRYTINGQIKTGQANVTFNVTITPIPSMTIKKSVLSYGNNSGDPVVFELVYVNNGTTTISSYDIVDYWPGTLNFVSATPAINSQTPNAGGSLLRWIFNSPIAPNGSGKIIINGTIR